MPPFCKYSPELNPQLEFCLDRDLLGQIIGSIDDIQDSSKLRRGSPVAHNIYGVAQTINSANYVYFQAQQHLMHLECWPRAIQIFNEEMLNLHRGQGMDLFWRDTSTVPTEEDYLQMISNKTGGLLRLLARLMMAMSKSNIDLVPFAEMLGLIFQIQDDYKNLLSSEMSAAKGYCEDLTEGKFSFPIIHAIRNSAPGNNEILHILRKRTEDTAIKDYAVTYMRDVTKSFEYTKTVLQGLHNQLKEMVEDIRPFNETIQVILAKLAVD